MTIRFHSLEDARALGLNVPTTPKEKKPETVERDSQAASLARQALDKRNRGSARDPQHVLAEAVRLTIGQRHAIALDHRPLTDQGSRFEVDVALPELRIAIEVDGWQYHGRFKKGFHRDRKKDRMLTLAGWRTLRFTYREIMGAIGEVLNGIEALIALVESESGWRPEIKADHGDTHE